MLASRPRERGFEPHRCHCVVSLSKNINPSLVLVQPRKTQTFITERLLMGRKTSNQTKTNKNYMLYSRIYVYSLPVLYLCLNKRNSPRTSCSYKKTRLKWKKNFWRYVNMIFPCPYIIRTFFMLNSVEHGISAEIF